MTDVLDVPMAVENDLEQDLLEQEFDRAEVTMTAGSQLAAIDCYIAILKNPKNDDEAVKIKEKCIYRLAKLHTENGNFTDVMNLLRSNSEFFSEIPKAKTAKIVRNILDIVAQVPNSEHVQITLCRDVVEWCKTEKRTFLRQRIEARLASLLLVQRFPQEALSIVTSLLKELKKLDDKQMLTEVHLLESRINHSLENIPKAKAALTASRTAANSIYVTPLMQAELDEMSGILHCEENDNLTAYSYFLEAHEAYEQVNDPRSLEALTYMCLCKILSDSPADVPSIISGKYGVKHADKLEAIGAVAVAAKHRSLEEFQQAVDKYASQLKANDLINHHLELLYEKMLESNLLRIINPFSCVEIEHVAKLIKLPQSLVEKKLSQMILDHKFSGILDQGRGHLLVYETTPEDVNYSHGMDVIAHMGLVTDALSSRAKGLTKQM